MFERFTNSPLVGHGTPSREHRIVDEVMRAVAERLDEAGLPYTLASLGTLAPTHPSLTGLRATLAGPSMRRVLAHVFTGSDTPTFSLKLEDTPTMRTVHLHSLLKHLRDPASFADFKFPWSAL